MAINSPSWQFATSFDPRRCKALEGFESYQSLVQRIATELTVVRFDVCRGKLGVVKNCLRAEFSLLVREETADAFFNSATGYRAQYLSAPETGQVGNALLIDAILERLLLSVPSFTTPKHEMSLDQVRSSLSAYSAKIWISDSISSSIRHQ